MSKVCTLSLILLLIFSCLVVAECANAQTALNENLAYFDVLAPSEGANVHAIGLLILAKNIHFNTVENFSDMVNFSSSAGIVSPAVSSSFSGGFWSGSVNVTGVTEAILGPDHKITIFVDDGYGHTGSTPVLITSYNELPNPSTATQQPTQMASTLPAPTVPEFPYLLVILLLLSTIAIALIVKVKDDKRVTIKVS